MMHVYGQDILGPKIMVAHHMKTEVIGLPMKKIRDALLPVTVKVENVVQQ